MALPVSLYEKIADLWSLSDDERNRLRPVEGQVVFIHKNLNCIFNDQARVTRWIKQPNKAFDGRSPLEMMLSGDIEQVRKYVMYHVYNA